MVIELERKNADLVKELEDFRRGQADLVKKHAEEVKRLETEKLLLELKLENLRRLLFGKKSEKLSPRADGLLQLELFSEAKAEIEAEIAEETETITYERKKHGGGRKPIPKELPRERVEIDVDPELRSCPDCKAEMGCIGEDISEELEYIPALFYVIQYALKKYACKRCQSGVITAQLPPRPIKKGRAGAGLLAHILVSKYHDHLPLNRLEQIFERHGQPISRKTLSDWVLAVGELLQPVVGEVKKGILKTRVVQADETPLKVKDRELSGKTVQGYMWTYGIADQEVVYDFTLSRAGAYPREFLKDFRGFLQTDAYSGYQPLFQAGGLTHVGCWAHARRKIFEARGEEPRLAEIFLACIQKLYRIERQIKDEALPGEALTALRRGESLPILKNLKAAFESAKASLLPQSAMGKAIAYALGQWEALERYVDIPEAKIDNNAAERSMRRIVLGRKNWLFVGHPEAGPRAAVILSLIETCRRLAVEPYSYLKHAIAEMAKAPERAAELTPRAYRDRQQAKAAASGNPPPAPAG